MPEAAGANEVFMPWLGDLVSFLEIYKFMIANLISGLPVLLSSVYPDASTLWSFPLHGSFLPTRNSGIAWFGLGNDFAP